MPDFRKGERVVLLDDDVDYSFLTYGKVYEILEEPYLNGYREEVITIRDDEGDECVYRGDLFDFAPAGTGSTTTDLAAELLKLYTT